MTRRTFFQSLIAALATLPFCGKLASAGYGHGINIQQRKGKAITRPGRKMTKWQPPDTAHSLFIWSNHVWWLDTKFPTSVFNKPISELSDDSCADTLRWSEIQDSKSFTA